METTIFIKVTASQMRKLHQVLNVRFYEAQHSEKDKGQQNNYKVVLRHGEKEKPQKLILSALKLQPNEMIELRKTAKAVQALGNIITRQTPEDSLLYRTRQDLFLSIKEQGYQFGEKIGDYRLTRIKVTI